MHVICISEKLRFIHLCNSWINSNQFSLALRPGKEWVSPTVSHLVFLNALDKHPNDWCLKWPLMKKPYALRFHGEVGPSNSSELWRVTGALHRVDWSLPVILAALAKP